MCRTRHVLSFIVLVVVVPALTPSIAQEAEGPAATPTIYVEAYSVGEEFWFFINNNSIKNPTLTLVPGETVQVTLVNKASIQHNLHFGAPIDGSFPLLEPAQQENLTFTVPADAAGGSEYWCDPHRDLGMNGTIRYGNDTGVHGIKLPLIAPLVPLLAMFLVLAAARRRTD